MSAGRAALLAGLFVVPALMLWLGHRLRRRGAVARGAFWGALVGHLVVLPAVLWHAMVPAVAWAPDDRVRGFFGFWALLLVPLLGAAAGAWRGRGTAG